MVPWTMEGTLEGAVDRTGPAPCKAKPYPLHRLSGPGHFLRLREQFGREVGVTITPLPGPYRLVRLGPVHLVAVKGMALPVAVQLPGHQRLHPAQEGGQPGTFMPGPGWHDGRCGGLSLRGRICLPPGLRCSLGCGDTGRLAAFLGTDRNGSREGVRGRGPLVSSSRVEQSCRGCKRKGLGQARLRRAIRKIAGSGGKQV